MIFCLSCQLPVVLQFNVWVAKRQQHSPTWSSLPASRLFWSTSCFQAGRLSVERPQTAPKYVHVIQRVKAEAQVTYLNTLKKHVQKDCVCCILRSLYNFIVFVELDLWFAQNHTLSLWRICPHQWRLVFHHLRRIGSKRSCPPVVSEQ